MSENIDRARARALARGPKPNPGHRLRLLEGMTSAVARKGYSSVSIADVVAEAGVSKRTFYEHFGGKEDCLLACYVEASGTLMAAIRQQLTGAAEASPIRIDDVLATYLGFLDRAPQIAVTLLIEVQRSGSEGRRVYRRNNLEFARLIRDAVTSVNPSAAGFDLDQSVALVGGLNALVLSHAEDHPDTPFRALTSPMVRFVRAVLHSP